MSSPLGPLLRRHRLLANLSQEGLAEAAGVSVSAIGAYERGIHSGPHRQTVTLLADALRLTGAARVEFETIARRKPRRSEELHDFSASEGLPLEATSFIGREPDVAAIKEMLRVQRLVTVTGIGGIGKTRVAIRVAAESKHLHSNNVAFADLSSVSDESLAIGRVASALDVPAGARVLDVAKSLKDRHVLLVVDNCEHLISAVGDILSTIVRIAPTVKVLATSRERLRIQIEAVYRLHVLPEAAAIQLFSERAAALDNDFLPADRDGAVIAGICRELNGIPLALELAAARVPSLGLLRLRDELEHNIKVLSSGSRDVPTRQQRKFSVRMRPRVARD